MINGKSKQLMTAYMSDVMNNACVDTIGVSLDGDINQPVSDGVEVITPSTNKNCCDNKQCDAKPQEQPQCTNPQMKEAVGLLLASSEATFEEKREALLTMGICSEITAMYSYWYSYMSSVTNGKADFDPEFKQHMDEEWEHAELLTNRLREVGCYNPVPRFCEFTECGPFEFIQEDTNDSLALLKQRIIEEEQAIEFYNICVNFFKETEDSTTLQIMKKIKAVEEEHLADLCDLRNQYE